MSKSDSEKLNEPGYAVCFDMPYDGTSEEKHISKAFPHVVLAIVRCICKVLWRYRVDNKESLLSTAEDSGVLVVCNHTSFLDVVFLYCSMRPQKWPRFIAKNTLFDGKPYVLGWMLAHLGVIPIHRDSADKTAIKRAVKFLKNREIVCIMPEGTRRGKSDMDPELHGGAALIARMAKVPILPVTVRNAEKIKEKGKMIRFPKVTVEYGTPISISNFDFLPKDERLDGCIWYAMRECFSMFESKSPEDVDMRGLFPNAKDYSKIFSEHPIVGENDSSSSMLDESASETETAGE